MQDSIDFVGIATALGTAAYAALGFDYLAVYELGLPPQAVCQGALLGAVLVGAFVGMKLLSRKLRKAKRPH